MLGLPGGFARNFNIWGGVGWGGDDTVPCNCTHLGATQLMFLSLAHISMLRNWCSLHLHTSRCYATDVSCTCTHVGATQLMLLSLAHISMLRNWCFLHLHTSRCYATDVPCTCTHLGATQLMLLSLAHISMLRNWCSLHLHTSRCYATDVSRTCTHLGATRTDVSCTCTHLDATQLMFLALAHMSMLRNWCFLHVHTSGCYATDVPCTFTHLGATQLMFFAIAHISVLGNWCSLHLRTSRCYATDLFRNRMHQVKLHQTACMANRVKWIRCKLQVIVDFSARFGEKNWRLDIVKTFNDQLHLKTWYAVYFWKKHFFYGITP